MLAGLRCMKQLVVVLETTYKLKFFNEIEVVDNNSRNTAKRY